MGTQICTFQNFGTSNLFCKIKNLTPQRSWLRMVILSLKLKIPFQLQKPSLLFSSPSSHLPPISKPSHNYLELLKISSLYPMVGEGVYQIPYLSGKWYIGQSRRSFKSHMKKHICDNISKSKVFEHSFHSKHLQKFLLLHPTIHLISIENFWNLKNTQIILIEMMAINLITCKN